MEYAIEQYHPLRNIRNSFAKQLNKGFTGFIRSLMNNTHKIEPVENTLPQKRNYFLQKYQQLLINGKTGNVQVIKVERADEVMPAKTVAIHLTFQLITNNGVRSFTSAAITTPGTIPVSKTVIPIFYNPDDLSVVVLL